LNLSRMLETGAHCNHIAFNKSLHIASQALATGEFHE